MHAVQLDVPSSVASVNDSSLPVNPSSSTSPSMSASHRAKTEQGDALGEDGRSRSSSRRRGDAGESTNQALELAKVCMSLSQATMLLEASMSDDKGKPPRSKPASNKEIDVDTIHSLNRGRRPLITLVRSTFRHSSCKQACLIFTAEDLGYSVIFRDAFDQHRLGSKFRRRCFES